MLWIYILYSLFSCVSPHVGESDLKLLHCELHPVSDKWYSLGVQLQVPIESLKCIEKENSEMTDRLLEMVVTWLKSTDPPPTWNILTKALESSSVGKKCLAENLKKLYCSGTEVEVTHSDPTQEPLLLGDLPISQGS